MAGSHPWLRRGWPVALVGASMFSCIGLCVGFPCFPTGIRFGMWVDQCPTTDLRLGARVQAHNLVRGDDVGRVEIWPWAQWLEGGGAHASVEQGELRRGVTTELSLLRNGEPVDGVRFVPTGEDYRYEVTLPAGRKFPGGSMSLSKWQGIGVVRPNGKPFPRPGQSAELKVLQGRDGPAFLMVKNFFVLKRYNNADKYALAVGLLADQIAGYPAPSRDWSRPFTKLSIAESEELQKRLKGAGFYDGEIDGKIGPASRTARPRGRTARGTRSRRRGCRGP